MKIDRTCLYASFAVMFGLLVSFGLGYIDHLNNPEGIYPYTAPAEGYTQPALSAFSFGTSLYLTIAIVILAVSASLVLAYGVFTSDESHKLMARSIFLAFVAGIALYMVTIIFIL